MRLSFTLPALAVLALAAGQVHAADTGECATPEAMTAKLKAEDQHSVASAQKVTPDKRLLGMIFTMSSDRKVGYILQADQPLGDRAGQICVWARMANIRFFDARKPGIPSAALLRAPNTDALKRCEELATQGKFQRGACGSLNEGLKKREAWGERVVLQGFAVKKAEDGSYQPTGSLATLTGRVGGSINDFANNPAAGILGALTYSSLPDGASILNSVLVYVDYTPYGLAQL